MHTGRTRHDTRRTRDDVTLWPDACWCCWCCCFLLSFFAGQTAAGDYLMRSLEYLQRMIRDEAFESQKEALFNRLAEGMKRSPPSLTLLLRRVVCVVCCVCRVCRVCRVMSVVCRVSCVAYVSCCVR